MNSYYINLDAKTERRLAIEANFARYFDSSFLLTRVPAVDMVFVLSRGIAGKCSAPNKGCLLSHKKAIELSLENDSNALILEDDALFGPSSRNALKVLDTLPDDSTDIIFTDLAIAELHLMLNLFIMKREPKPEGVFECFDTKGLFFGGTTAYLVSNRAKRKILDLIGGLSRYDLPWDLQLRLWTNEGRLKAKFAFPFITTLSDQADSSSIQLADNAQAADLMMNAFRRLMWVDSESVFENPVACLQKIPADFVDAYAQNFAKIFSVYLSSNFVRK